MNRILRAVVVALFALSLATIAGAQAPPNALASVNLSFNQSESLTLTIVGTTPISFNAAGAASNPFTAAVTGNFAVQRWVIVEGWFSGTAALSGTSGTIPVDDVTLTTSTPASGTGISNGSACNQPGLGTYPGGNPPNNNGGTICPAIFIGQRGPGFFNDVNPSVTLALTNILTQTPGSYTGVLNVGASAA